MTALSNHATALMRGCFRTPIIGPLCWPSLFLKYESVLSSELVICSADFVRPLNLLPILRFLRLSSSDLTLGKVSIRDLPETRKNRELKCPNLEKGHIRIAFFLITFLLLFDLNGLKRLSMHCEDDLFGIIHNLAVRNPESERLRLLWLEGNKPKRPSSSSKASRAFDVLIDDRSELKRNHLKKAEKGP